MPSSSLTPYYTNSAQFTFQLATTSETGACYKIAGRPLSTPYQVEIIRKVTPSAATANDHVILRATLIGRNATTSKLATASVSVDVSIPKDAATISETDVIHMLGVIASLINDSAALQSTTVNATALLEGRDL